MRDEKNQAVIEVQEKLERAMKGLVKQKADYDKERRELDKKFELIMKEKGEI